MSSLSILPHLGGRPLDVLVPAHIALDHGARGEGLYQGPHSLANHLGRIGEGQLRTFRVESSGDGPGNRHLVGNPGDQGALAAQEPPKGRGRLAARNRLRS